MQFPENVFFFAVFFLSMLIFTTKIMDLLSSPCELPCWKNQAFSLTTCLVQIIWRISVFGRTLWHITDACEQDSLKGSY